MEQLTIGKGSLVAAYAYVPLPLLPTQDLCPTDGQREDALPRYDLGILEYQPHALE